MKYFVISDIHSFYKSTSEALDKKGFRKNYNDHTLIVNGDVFDRGNESQEIKDYLDGINNKICIIGNHEILLLDAINRGEFYNKDLINGTLDTAIQLSGGYDSYPNIHAKGRAIDFFARVGVTNEVDNKETQELIIKNLISTNIVEWIVNNFYTNGSRVVWTEDKKSFTITGKPRYYIQIKNKLIMHGFFPTPDWNKSYMVKRTGKIVSSILPDDYELLDEATNEMWEEYGCGVWANTPYWLKNFYEYNLVKLYDYIIKRNIKYIYIGHWDKNELENMVVSISITPTYMKYRNKMPIWYFTDDNVVITEKVIVKTFTV